MKNENMPDSKCLENTIEEFFKEMKTENKEAYHRYSSFDYCYNYFYKHRDNPSKLKEKENIEVSCMYLGFYLASWGMYRGSTAVLNYNSKIYEPIIKEIAEDKNSKEYWEIDVNNYNEDNIEKLYQLKEKIQKRLNEQELKLTRKNKKIRETKEQKDFSLLATKIMLGIFGNTPAFDTYVTAVIKKYKDKKQVGEDLYKSQLKKVKKIYDFEDNKNKIEELHNKYKTIDFSSTKDKTIYTKIPYTQAKLIDMFAWQKYKNNKNRNNSKDII